MILTVILILLTALPFQKGNAQCPSNYFQSGAYCVPITDKAPDAVPKPKGSQCPSGWATSGGACIRMQHTR